MPGEAADGLARFHVPQPKIRLVLVAGERPPVVGGEGHTHDRIVRPLVAAQFLTALHVPQAHRLVPAPGEEALPVVREGYDSHPTPMPLEAPLLFAGLQVPEPNNLVVADRDNTLAIRRN